MSIEDQVEAVKQWLKFAEAWRQSTGNEPRLQDYADALRSSAQEDAIQSIKQIAQEMLGDDFTSDAGKRLLAGLESVGL